RSPVVVDVDVTATPRGPPFRVPHVFVGGKSTPHPGELDVRAGIEHAIGNPGEPNIDAVVVQLEGSLVGAEAGGAFGVAHVETDHVAARQVEPGTCCCRPAILVCRMAIVDHVGRRVIGAAGVMQRAADAGEAPGLINAQVGDDVRHAEAEAAASARIDRHAVVVDGRTVKPEEGGGGDVDCAAA